jgi:tetratricopeptide (TPR) repeat protein
MLAGTATGRCGQWRHRQWGTSMSRVLVLAAALIFGTSAAFADVEADCFNESGNAAIKACDSALNSKPKSAPLFTSRGFEYAQLGETDRAIADYNKAIDLDPQYAVAYYNRAVAYNKKQDYSRAIGDMTKAIALGPTRNTRTDGRVMTEDRDLADYYAVRGRAYRESGELDRALADFTKAIELDPGYVTPFFGRAQTYEKQGNPKSAIADYRRALEADPKSKASRDALERLGASP